MEHDLKRQQTFLLRLPVSVREQAADLAQRDGTSLNHFISLALAEKISRMEQHQALTLAKTTPRASAAPLPTLRFARTA